MRYFRYLSGEKLSDPKIIYALKALRHIAPQDVKAVTATVIAENDESGQWEKSNRLKQSKGHVCACRLVGKNCKNNYEATCRYSFSGRSWNDHATLWLADRKPALIVTQPYQMDVVDLVEFCRERGLEPRVGTQSWWYPGRTLMVEISTPDLWRKLRDRSKRDGT